jgi:DNA-directed RNA polymerase specialized sigma24 family protein
MMRMRFPLSEDGEPKSLPEIATMLGVSEKAVDGRIRRVLSKCKEMMLKHGLSISDLIVT